MAIIYRFEHNRIFNKADEEKAWDELVETCRKVIASKVSSAAAKKLFSVEPIECIKPCPNCGRVVVGARAEIILVEEE